MQKIILILFLSTNIWAGFNFGACSGSGTFEQTIEQYRGDYEKTVTVGEIPAGIKGLHIELVSEKDVDIRLYGQNHVRIIHWPRGLLRKATMQTKSYQGLEISYSGFNGLAGKRGHESVEIVGTTTSTMTMKAFGYQSGYATVNYSWTGKEGCTQVNDGTGTFTQNIASKESNLVGTIPPNLENVKIVLDSDKDLDIQLFGVDGTSIVSWKPQGLLSGGGEQTLTYHGMQITWSGYNGIAGKKGHESIRITGKTTEQLVMKVYGYESGMADVTYSWGHKEDLVHAYGVATQGTTLDSKYHYYGSASKVVDGNTSSYNHTRDNNENWVQVAFPVTASIDVLKITVGNAGSAYRLENAKVYIRNTPYHTADSLTSSDAVATLKGTTGTQSFTLPQSIEGKYILVKASDGKFLHLSTIKAYGTIDAAISTVESIELLNTYGFAAQGTKEVNYQYYKPALNVLDHDDATYHHTRNSNENWIEVRLPADANIGKIKVKGGLSAHAYRLKHAKIYLRDTAYKTGDTLDSQDLIASLEGHNVAQWVELNGHKQGQYILIKADGTNFLHIASIEAYGVIDPAFDSNLEIDLASKYATARQGTLDTNYIYFNPAVNVLDHDSSTYNHTRNSNENWVEVALPLEANVAKVKVQVGLAPFVNRLKHAKVYLRDSVYNTGDTLDDSDVIGTLQGTGSEQWFELSTHRQGQYILVKGAGTDFLHIAKIEVFGVMDPLVKVQEKIDLARVYGEARQGTADGYIYYKPAANVLDHDESSYNHTSNSSENWIEVTLPKSANISRLKIKVGLEVFASRLHNAKVYLRDTPYHTNDLLDDKDVVATMKGIATVQWFDIDSSKHGRYVVIKGQGHNYLHIASLEAYGVAKQAPEFSTEEKTYLISASTQNATELTRVRALDFQNGTVTYKIVNSAPFSIDANGLIRTNGSLTPGTTYTVQVEASDGTHSSISVLKVKITTATAVNDALSTARVYHVTAEELLEAAIAEADTTAKYASIKKILLHISAKDYNFDWSVCKHPNGSLGEDNENCGDVVGLNSEFIDGFKSMRSILGALDSQKNQLFTLSGHRFEKLIVLLGDKYRQSIVYPMDKVNTDFTELTQAYLADASVYNYRNYNRAQPDLGNFSRSDFSHITPVNKTLALESKKHFKAAGVYALPGKAVTVKRNDNSDVSVSIYVNSLREGSTHYLEKFGYSRPKYLQSRQYKIDSGETITFTSAYGGPIQIRYGANGKNVNLTFNNIGEHPYWASTADNDSFTEKLDANDYDWAEISTPGFEIHSKRSKMITSVADERWGGTAEGLAAAVYKYTSNYPHVLAGFQGAGIDQVPEIHDWADARGITINEVDFMKHMNADQATCGYGCSGNPYDAYWAFDPIFHGDIHELGHSLQSRQFEGFPNHAGTNPYAYYTKAKYFDNTGKKNDCGSHPFKTFYETLQAAQKSNNVANYLHTNLWDTSKHGERLGERYLVTINAYMHAQNMGKLSNGWHVLARVHILDREIWYRARHNWAARKASVGFSSYSMSEYNAMRTNDWMVIAYSYAAQVDYRDYFDMVGIPYSQKARDQIASFGFDKVPKRFFVSTGVGYCNEDEYGRLFDRPSLPVDGTTAYTY